MIAMLKRGGMEEKEGIRRQTQKSPELSCSLASTELAMGGKEGCDTHSQKTDAQTITATSIQHCCETQVSSLVSVYECNGAF